MYAQIDNIRDNDPIRPGVFIEVLLEGNPVEELLRFLKMLFMRINMFIF